MIPMGTGSASLWRQLPTGRICLDDLIRRSLPRKNITVATNEFFETMDYSKEEVRKIGTDPFFIYTIYPHYFQTGIAEDEGTFVDTTFISPDRIQVDEGVTSASWTSDELIISAGALPTLVTLTWTLNSPAFDVVIEIRTASSSAALATASYMQMSSGYTIYLSEYYQWRISFSGFRIWAYDTQVEAEAASDSAWALDAEDPSDPYQSYASDGITGDSYIEDVVISGEFRIPDADVLDGGSLSLPATTDFSSLISADHSMRLVNRNNQYSPRHANFIFSEEDNWQRKNLKIEFGFNLPDGGETNPILLYVGNILKWGPTDIFIDSESYEAGEVEIYSRDAISLFMEQKIGTPSDDGTPNPVVCGRIMREATKLGENSLETPEWDVDYEDSILNEVSSVDISGTNNLVELTTTDPYEDLQCLRSYVESIGYAKVRFDLDGTSDNILFKSRIKFETIPTPPGSYTANFFRINIGGSDLISLDVATDYRVYLNMNGTRKETDWYINQNQGIWSDFGIGVYAKNPGLVRITLNGDQVLDYSQDDGGDPLNLLAYAAMLKASLGISTSSAQTWEVCFDESKFYDVYYPEAYCVPGAPYEEIGTVYIDGIVKVSKTETGINKTYASGKAVDSIDMTKYENLGMVVFGDITNPPSGSVFFMLTKDDNVHPSDAITVALTALDRDDIIDTISFARAKNLRPDDSIGCYFEDITLAEAILEISRLSLLNVVIAQGKIKLLPYDGIAPVYYDWIVDTSVCSGLSHSDDIEPAKNKIDTKWGGYEQNSRLFHAAKDDASIAKIGVFEEELDYSWGNAVGSDNAEMAKNRAGCLLNRLSGSLVLYEDVLLPSWQFIRAEIGDEVNFNIPYFGAAERIRVVSKDISMTRPFEVRLGLALYPGEA